VEPGDVVVVSGPLGDHGAAVLAKRDALELESILISDCAPVTPMTQAILQTAARVSFMRDVTRGGLATVLNEAVDSGLGLMLDEPRVPFRPEVRSICELLGLDPLYLACEGRVAAIVDGDSAPSVVKALRGLGGGEQACPVGTVTEHYAGRVVAETAFGTHRLVQMLSGEQLPRIC
jgi:hydrogenase expression/formation protein HypE